MHPKAEIRLIEGSAGPLQTRILDNGSGRWALLCHPHPLYGGSMDNKVIVTVERALQQKGWSTCVFNFRGVGESAGEYSGGQGERLDLLAVHRYLQDQHEVSHLLLGGFSFGAYISLSAWPQLTPQQLLSLAPPVGLWPFDGIRTPECPWVVIQGGADEVVAPDAVWAWLSSLERRPTLYWRDGVSHFFHRQLIWLREVIKLEY